MAHVMVVEQWGQTELTPDSQTSAMPALKDLPIGLPRPTFPDNVRAIGDSGTRYRLDTILGEGAVAVVYRATPEGKQTPSANRVAVKILCPLQHIVRTTEGYSAIAQRFLAESRRARRLSHANLPAITDTGHLGRTRRPWSRAPFYVMRLVNGGSLAALISTDAPPYKARVSWAVSLSQAVSYLHANGVLHRDIKPHNILIGASGELVLGDLGVAHWGEFARPYTDGITTGTSEVLSTWNYLPPEAEVDPSAYDERSDVWALAKTVLEILAWRFLPRALLLTGATDAGVEDSQLVATTLKAAVSNDPTDRPSIHEITETLGGYYGFLCLEPVNIDYARRAVASFRPTDKPDYIRAYYRPDRALAQIDRYTERPHYEGGHGCPLCASPYTVTFATLENTPPEADSFEYHICFSVCLGRAGQLCGGIWNWHDDT